MESENQRIRNLCPRVDQTLTGSGSMLFSTSNSGCFLSARLNSLELVQAYKWDYLPLSLEFLFHLLPPRQLSTAINFFLSSLIKTYDRRAHDQLESRVHALRPTYLFGISNSFSFLLIIWRSPSFSGNPPGFSHLLFPSIRITPYIVLRRVNCHVIPTHCFLSTTFAKSDSLLGKHGTRS